MSLSAFRRRTSDSSPGSSNGLGQNSECSPIHPPGQARGGRNTVSPSLRNGKAAGMA